MNCPHCGAIIDDRARNCIECGRRIEKIKFKEIENIRNKPHLLLKLISFLLPPLGFFFFLIIGGKRNPAAKKTCIKASIFGTLFYIILGALYFLFLLFVLIGIFT